MNSEERNKDWDLVRQSLNKELLSLLSLMSKSDKTAQSIIQNLGANKSADSN